MPTAVLCNRVPNLSLMNLSSYCKGQRYRVVLEKRTG
jgi:hypothetical protein